MPWNVTVAWKWMHSLTISNGDLHERLINFRLIVAWMAEMSSNVLQYSCLKSLSDTMFTNSDRAQRWRLPTESLNKRESEIWGSLYAASVSFLKNIGSLALLSFHQESRSTSHSRQAGDEWAHNVAHKSAPGRMLSNALCKTRRAFVRKNKMLFLRTVT